MITKKNLLASLIIIALLFTLSFFYLGRFSFINSNNQQCLVSTNFKLSVNDLVYIENEDGPIRYSARILAKPGDKFNFDINNKIFTINDKRVEISFDQSENTDMLVKKMRGILPENTYLVYPEGMEISFNVFLTKMYIKNNNIVTKNILCY